MAGLLPLIAADAMLAWSNHWSWGWAGVTLWGLHMAMTQGLLATMVADAAPGDLRGTAFGLFNLVSGVAMLLASVLAGLPWDQLGAAFTFAAGGAFGLLALMLIGFQARAGCASSGHRWGAGGRACSRPSSTLDQKKACHCANHSLAFCGLFCGMPLFLRAPRRNCVYWNGTTSHTAL